MTGYNGSPPRLRDVPHRIVAVHFDRGYVICSCAAKVGKPGLSFDGVRDAYTAHRQEMGQRSGHAHGVKTA